MTCCLLFRICIEELSFTPNLKMGSIWRELVKEKGLSSKC
jgi:hypothetical protein